jgi:hypothetical protein
VYIGATSVTDWLAGRQEKDLQRLAVAGPATIDAAMAAVARYRQLGPMAEGKQQEQARIFAQLARSTGLSMTQLQQAMADRLNYAKGDDRNAWEKLAGLDPKRLGGGFSTYGSGPSDIHYDTETISRELAKGFSGMMELASRKAFSMLEDVGPKWNMMTDVPAGTGKKGDIKITINRIEVISDDPDRFAFGLEEMVQTAVRNGNLTPASAQAAMSRG